MSTEGNGATAGDDAGPDSTPDPAPTESAAAPEPTAASPRSSAPSASFDVAAVPRSVWISALGALVLLISVFFSWYTATASVSPAGGGSLSKTVSGRRTGTRGSA